MLLTLADLLADRLEAIAGSVREQTCWILFGQGRGRLRAEDKAAFTQRDLRAQGDR